MKLACNGCNATTEGTKKELGRSCAYCGGTFERQRVKPRRDPHELDLSAYFVLGEAGATIPSDLDLDGKDLRAHGRGIWSVVEHGETRERHATLDFEDHPNHKGDGWRCIWLR